MKLVKWWCMSRRNHIGEKVRLYNKLGISKVGGIVGGCTVTRFFCDSVILLLGAKNSKFEFFWREKMQNPQFGAQYQFSQKFIRFFIIQTPRKVGKCHNSCKNFKFQFSRQKFEFDFLAPKMSNFSVLLGLQNFSLQQSGLNQKMPLIKVVQIGLLYHQLRAFPQILTLTIVKIFDKVQEM